MYLIARLVFAADSQSLKLDFRLYSQQSGNHILHRQQDKIGHPLC